MRLVSFTAAAALALAACGSGKQSAEAQPGNGVAADLPFTVTPVATFNTPWAMTFLPDGRLLVTEKGGQMKLATADGKTIVDVTGTPEVDYAGQGSLMDVVLSPHFARDRLVYLSASQAGNGGKGVVLMRARLEEAPGSCLISPCAPDVRLTGLETLFRASPLVEGDGHYSGRIAFSPDGQYLFFTAGDRQKFDPAQDPKATLGKVLRLTPDGKPAPGNPLTAKGFAPEVWSYGHRNLLGLAFDGAGNLWEQEMGPRGGDEVNLILPGRNYGWPRASNGDHYEGPPKNGADIPDHRPGDGFEPPKVWWNPVISPAGLMIYSGNMFPQWRGDAFIGGLSSQSLVRVDLDGTSALKGDQWPMGARIREVEQGPDGAIWLLEDGGRGSRGRLLRLTPRG